MENTSRRNFMTIAGAAAVAWAGACPTRFTNAQTPTDDLEHKLLRKPLRIYERGNIPRVDIHSHIGFDKLHLTEKVVETMDAGQVAVSVNLTATPEMLEQADSIRKKWNARILICPADFDTTDGLWWSEEDLVTFKEKRCAGTKIWAHYRRRILAPEFVQKVRRQGELGLPVIGLHIADPPEFVQKVRAQGERGQSVVGPRVPDSPEDKPSELSLYWTCIREAENLIERCPETTFIMAHGFWLMNEDRGLDVLADYFDRYSNLNVDLSAVYQWWSPPEPSYNKLRDFIISYKERILFGTDGTPNYTTPELLANAYRVLESSEDQLVSSAKKRISVVSTSQQKCSTISTTAMLRGSCLKFAGHFFSWATIFDAELFDTGFGTDPCRQTTWSGSSVG